jgi:dTDP-4-amino-4,6-dideoxygalactose transaminase
MDPRELTSAIAPTTLAVLPVHLFGQPCDLGQILAASRGRPVIEDAAQAIGATCQVPQDPAGGMEGARRGASRHAGTIGRLGCLSFYPTKNLGCAGDGGMVLAADEPLAERLRKLRVHGGRQMYHHEEVGWNSRLDEIQAAILRVKLPRLRSWCAARAERADRYDQLLRESGLVDRGLVTLPARMPGRTHTFHQYVVRVPSERGEPARDRLREHLASRAIGTGVYYPVPLHLQPCFRWLGHAAGDFPVSERAAKEVLALPIYPEIDAGQQEAVIRAIGSYFGLA